MKSFKLIGRGLDRDSRRTEPCRLKEVVHARTDRHQGGVVASALRIKDAAHDLRDPDLPEAVRVISAVRSWMMVV
jgi:hypothetical protein